MKNDRINNVYIIWLVCSLSAATLAGAVHDKSASNAADIYQNIFDRYPSKEVKEVEQKIKALLVDSGSQKEDFSQYSKKSAELKANPAYQLKQKVEAYADGKTPLTPEIETYIRQQRPVLDLIRQACEIKTCNWPDIPNHAENLFDEIDKIMDRSNRMRGIYFLAIAEARLDADQARYKGALAKIVGTFPMIHHAGNSTYLEHLMCLRTEQIALGCLRDILGRMPVDITALKMLETQLNKENEQFPSFRECILGEKEFFVKTMSTEDVIGTLKVCFNVDPNSIPQITDDYMQKSIDYNNHYMDQVNQVLDLPYAEALHKLEQIEGQAVKNASVALDIKTRKVRSENMLKTNALLTALRASFYSNLSMEYTIHTKTKTQMLATLAAVKLYQSFAQTKQLPQTLPQNCPADLFSGKPFEYEINGDGFILRCAGKDIGSEKTIEYQFALNAGDNKKSGK